MVRAIPYTLERGKLTGEAASNLKNNILARLRASIQGVASKDSPLFQLIPKFPKIDLPHEVTEIFQDQVKHSEEFRQNLANARVKGSDSERLAALMSIRQSLGDLKTAQSEILVDLMLSYRDVSAWDHMVRLSEDFPDHLKANVIVRQQRALALNRRNQAGDREQAQQILDDLLKEKGLDPETLGILGRVHKDRYRELKKKQSFLASAALDDAIEAYTKGFESDPRDYYPGVNAITLLIEKGDEDALKEADRMVPLVSFAVARRGGAASSDYWDLATVLELSAIGNEWKLVNRILPKALAAGNAAWMIKTTRDNLLLLKSARDRIGQKTSELDETIRHLEERYNELCGEAAKM
jgi:tetratricopeptide (TPR) repeat protein